MTVKIDKYYIEENNGNYHIYDKSYYKDRLIIRFELESSEKNKQLAEELLQILNTGGYEWKEVSTDD